MFVDFLLNTFERNRKRDAIVWQGRAFSYHDLLLRYHQVSNVVSEHVTAGAVVALRADYSPSAIATILALIEARVIIVPLTSYVESKVNELLTIAEVELNGTIESNDRLSIQETGSKAKHEIYQALRHAGHPGLVLFSSGSTGLVKAAVHDFKLLLDKFKTPRHDLRTMTFLLLDHIGGIDTLFYTLSNGSCVVTVSERSPDSVCKAVEEWKVEVLPVTPTFLNLLILSQAYERFNMSSLKYITYGTEVMPEATLKRVSQIFPGVTLLQKYGTTETGTLRSKSKDDTSTWVKVGGEGFQTRIVNGMLEIKAHSAMLGYLNAPSPYTSDGWFVTGDLVEQEGDYIRFLGRQSDVINVGGEKVYPAEVENVIQQVENVAGVTVFGEKNPLTGNIVCARVTLVEEEDHKEVVRRVKEYCRGRLENFKIPIKIAVVASVQYSERFKKTRPRTTH